MEELFVDRQFRGEEHTPKMKRLLTPYVATPIYEGKREEVACRYIGGENSFTQK